MVEVIQRKESLQFYQRMPRPLITLTTDFGLEDHYTGTMKGVILSRCPDAQLVDVSHNVPKFNIYAGAYTIDQSAPYFPEGSIHVVVIDPGVGTERKPLVAEAYNRLFVAPDNGVLTLVLARDPNTKIREISKDLWVKSASATFHGRDVFAPVAGALAAGTIKPQDVGSIVKDAVLLQDLEPREIRDNHWQGMVISVDHFGNVITNFRATEFGPAIAGNFVVTVGFVRVTQSRKTFAGAEPSLCFVYLGSSGYLEIGMNQDDAASRLGVKPRDGVELRLER